MSKKCKICQKPIFGRTDKVFCTPGCKNLYHSKLRYATKRAAVEINRYLIRNHGILLELLGKNRKQIKVHRNVMAQKKFRFKYHTHTYQNNRNKTYHYIYDLAWMEFSDDEILIIRKR